MSIIGIEVLLSAVLGISFLAAAVPKLRHPKGFVLAVLEYRVLPPRRRQLQGADDLRLGLERMGNLIADHRA